MMRTTATNKKLRELLLGIGRGSVELRPGFQRRLVWANRHKVAFVKTVLDGLPFPEIYTASGEVNVETGEGVTLIVDGQQRLSTLHQYFSGSAEVKLDSGTSPFSVLSQEAKLAFLEYDVVVRDLGAIGAEQIKEVFKRINSTQYSLNAMEVHNAVYEGAMKEASEELANDDFFSKFRVFSPNEVRRMSDVGFALTIIATVLGGYFHRDAKLEYYLSQYNDEFSGGREVLGGIYRTLRLIEKMNILSEERSWNKADIFTLIVELFLAAEVGNRQLDLAALRIALLEFYRNVDASSVAGSSKDTAVDVWAAYRRDTLQATNDRSSRIRRGRTVAAIIAGVPLIS